MLLETATDRVNSVWLWHLWCHIFGGLGEAVTADDGEDDQVKSGGHLHSQHEKVRSWSVSTLLKWDTSSELYTSSECAIHRVSSPCVVFESGDRRSRGKVESFVTTSGQLLCRAEEK